MIKAVAVLRAKELQEQRPEALVTQELLEDRAIVSVRLNDRILETDFIESKNSILHPRRCNEYYDVLGQGIKLGIIVPTKDVEVERVKLKRVKGPDRLVVLGYDENLGYHPAAV
ncbi:MAG: hypothetical protein SA339_09365 [Methanomassiliicoccus sp.]|nr:hypothetical protein [Methanomassiliicoccus sp.]